MWRTFPREASSRPDKMELLGRGRSRSKRSNMIVAIHPAVGAVCLANILETKEVRK